MTFAGIFLCGVIGIGVVIYYCIKDILETKMECKKINKTITNHELKKIEGKTMKEILEEHYGKKN